MGVPRPKAGQDERCARRRMTWGRAASAEVGVPPAEGWGREGGGATPDANHNGAAHETRRTRG